jgi:SAM-dependent methyltransferase
MNTIEEYKTPEWLEKILDKRMLSGISIEGYHEAFPKYPEMTSSLGWIHGVWYCGTSWRRVRLHGQYPPGFLERTLSLFPDAKDILHCPSGTVEGPGMTVDLVRDAVRRPKVQASADKLPFPDDSFDLHLSDPPYTKKDSRKYGCPPFPMGGMMAEARRVLRPGGHLCVLHTSFPMYRRREWDLRGLIAVTTGFCRATRVLSIFRSRKGEESREWTCHLCKAVRAARPRWWTFGLDPQGIPHPRGGGEWAVCGRCHGVLARAVEGGTEAIRKVFRRYDLNLAEKSA